MPSDIGFAVVSDVYHRTVFRIKLTYGVVPGDAAVLTEGNDDLVLEYSFGVNKDRLLNGGDLSSLYMCMCIRILIHTQLYLASHTVRKAARYRYPTSCTPKSQCGVCCTT